MKLFKSQYQDQIDNLRSRLMDIEITYIDGNYIKELKKEISGKITDLNQKITSMEAELWEIRNPPTFFPNDKVVIQAIRPIPGTVVCSTVNRKSPQDPEIRHYKVLLSTGELKSFPEPELKPQKPAE
jgi:hypothetical protein